MTSDLQTLPDKLMDAEAIAEKKKQLQHLNNEDTKENVPPSPLTNGHTNGKCHTPKDKEMDTTESSDEKPVTNNISQSESKPETIQKHNDLKMTINLKRQAIDQLETELSNEEAKYTILKKIRIATHQEKESRKEEAKTEKIATTQSSKVKTIASENKFKPIQPASGNSAMSSPTVLSPTPSKSKPIKKITNVRDVDDVVQLANYLATNPRLSENEKAHAQKLVFRKQMDKYLKSCPPPEPEKTDVIFFPSNNSSEFVNLTGLEQVVHHIKVTNSRKKDAKKNPYENLANAADWAIKETKLPGPPNCCHQCGIDFSPQWYMNLTDNTKVLCSSCVAQNRKKYQVKDYGKKIRETFANAIAHEKKMKLQLKEEYEARSKAYKAEEERKQALANKQIMALKAKAEERQKRIQADERKSQALAQQLQAARQLAARKQASELQNYIQSQKKLKQQSSSSNATSPMEAFRQILTQFSKTTNGQVDSNKLMAMLQTQLVAQGMHSQEVVRTLQMLMAQHQAEQKKKQEEEERKKRELERQRRLEEERKRKQAEDSKKQTEQQLVLKQLTQLITQTSDQAKQQQLFQMIIKQMGNNPEQQKKILEQICQMMQQQSSKKK